MNGNKNEIRPSQGSPVTIVVGALCALGLLSMLPWGDMTGNRLKDFNLLADILHSAPAQYITEEIIDPALAEALAAVDAEDSVDDNVAAAPTDTAAVLAVAVVPEHVYESSPRVDGEMVVEDYSGGEALARLRAAVASGRLRCAMIGDSYIEGDIFSSAIRRLLNERFGGAGVGYVPMTSAVAGFRRTVRLESDGFTACDIRHNRLDSLHTLPGEFFRASAGARASFKGEKNGRYTASWTRSRLLFMAPADGTISTSADGGASWTEHQVTASGEPQCIEVAGETSRFDVRCNVPGLVVFGAWLDSPAGAGVDCMSLRGYSGISHRSLSIPTARSMARWVDYDMIVVEYGMNALSSEQSDYTAYGNLMKRVLLRIQACYPDAAIVMLGVGDRGQKQGTEIASLPTVSAIVHAQRKAAREAGVMFWDMREAMGGEGSVVDWRSKGLVNADYIHLNHKGGEQMGKLFVESLTRVLDE